MQDRAKIGTKSNSTGVPEIIYNVTKVLFSHTKTWQAVNNWCLAQPYRKPLAETKLVSISLLFSSKETTVDPHS